MSSRVALTFLLLGLSLLHPASASEAPPAPASAMGIGADGSQGGLTAAPAKADGAPPPPATATPVPTPRPPRDIPLPSTTDHLRKSARALVAEGDLLGAADKFLTIVNFLGQKNLSSWPLPLFLGAMSGAELMEESADALSAAHRYAEALSLREVAYRLRWGNDGHVRGSAVELITGGSALVEEYLHLSLADDALALLERMDDDLKRRMRRETPKSGKRAKDLARALLEPTRARALACAGDHAAALALLEGLNAGGAYEDAGERLAAIEAARRAGNVARAQELTAAALVAGPWTRGDQLPVEYTAGLTARAWHDLPAEWPELAPLADELESAAAALAEEWEELRAAGKPEADSQCLHDAALGGWSQLSITAPWMPRDTRGCAAAAPIACRTLRALRALKLPGLRILRAGYSALAPGARTHAHSGPTNDVLKLHLGLTIPTRDGEPCAHMRVGSETRAWAAGDVLMLDDSFDHEAVNSCQAERVIFQVVIAHPESERAKAPTKKDKASRSEPTLL